MAIEEQIALLKGRTRGNVQRIFDAFGTDLIFGRKDVSIVCDISYSAAGKVIVKMKEHKLITDVKGSGKGKYKFEKSI